MASDAVVRGSSLSKYKSLLHGAGEEAGQAGESEAPVGAVEDDENMPLGEKSNDGEPAMARDRTSRRHCSKKAVASSLALAVGVVCCATLYYTAPPPMQLTVDSISPSGMQSTFTRPDLNTTISASTTNSSFATSFNGRSLISKERKVVAGFPIVRTTILHKSFVTLTTAQNRSVTVQAAHDTPLSEPFLRLLYEESPDIRFAVQQAVASLGAVMDTLLADHRHLLNAFVDMAWNLGEVKHISGAEHPHVLEMYLIAMELSKDMDRPPRTIARSTANGEDDRRRLQSSGCSCPANLPTCGSDGWCYSGSDYSGGSGCGARWGSSCGDSYHEAVAAAVSTVSSGSGCTCGSTYSTCGHNGWCYDGSDYSGGFDCGGRFGDSCAQSHTSRDAERDSWGCTCPTQYPTCSDGWCYHGSDYSDTANCGARFGTSCTESSTQVHSTDACSLENDPNNDCCDGMCGEGCNCWSYACGDCCAHKLCVDHDECCRTLGMASTACLGIAFSYELAQCGQPYDLHSTECVGCTCGSSLPRCGSDGWCYSGSDYSEGSGCGARHGPYCSHDHDGALKHVSC